MRIGGLEPCSLSDYPGKVAAVVFTQGCNFRCPFCHNGQLLPVDVPPGRLSPPAAVLEHLQRVRGKVEAVVVSGGEPTLQDDLADFLTAVRALGLAVKLDTNGSRPKVLRRILEAGQVDCVAMDIKAPWDNYSLLTGVPAPVAAIRESVALLSDSALPHEFRTTFVPALLTDEDLAAIRAQLPPTSAHRVQRFIAANALDSRLRAPAGTRRHVG